MLYLIGLGLWDEKDITLRGLEKARECDLVFLESYTSKLMGTDEKRLGSLIGKQIQPANRSFIEEGTILAYAKSNKVALLVPGDPFVATTHSDLILQAKEKNVKCEIIHNASILSAMTECGLQAYKFGRSATITFWEGDYRPTSWFDAYKENRERGLHTLFFLDIQMEKNRFLTAQQAIKQLLEAGLSRGEKIIVCSQLGGPNAKISFGAPDDLLQRDIGLPLQIIIVPGALHEKEKEYLEKLQ
ncbi:MAG: diphthine synthase [archaeon]